jgi:hypothetical protein
MIVAAEPACLRLHVFRVNEGLGNACVLQFPDGSCGVLDWGTKRTEPLEKALNLIRPRLRFVAATHPHADHVGGMERLLLECSRRHIRVERFFYPAATLYDESRDFSKVLFTVERLKIESCQIGEDSFLAPAGERKPPCLAFGDDLRWDLRVLAPPITLTSHAAIKSAMDEKVPGNETSLVALFRFLRSTRSDGIGQALLTGDATEATLYHAARTALAHGYEIENHAFLVPHHGSGNNLPEWLVPCVRGVAVISGPANSQYHPAQATLEMLSRRTSGTGSRLYCTAYGVQCAKAFGHLATTDYGRKLVQPGHCFGDIVVNVPEDEEAFVESTSADGRPRRQFGYCGNSR